MDIAIIGGGITGLTAAYTLTKQGHHVTVFEKEDHLGGLAGGFKGNPTTSGWEWTLEQSYHHLFTSDHSIIRLMKKLGIDDKLIIKRPITANLLPYDKAGAMRIFSKNDKRTAGSRKNTHGASSYFAQLDSPLHLLRFPGLSIIDKLRTGALVAFCKLYPFWQTLEGVTAKDFFTNVGGSSGWRMIWEPLMTGKFGHFDDTIAASWLWARIHKRTSSLCYIEGGFSTLVDTLEKTIKQQGGTIVTGVSIDTIKQLPNNKNSQFLIHNSKFDAILITTPTTIATTLLPRLLTTDYLLQASKIPHLHAQTLILETEKPILDNTYWLSITDRTFPFLAVVAHTNFIDKKHYGGHDITYVGNYLPDGHPYLSMTKEQLLKKFMPYILRLSPDSKFLIHNSYLYTAPYAQPVHQLHYSRRAPKLHTGIPGIYLANMDSIYPWDRGTNYAVELGQKAAREMSSPAL